MAKLKDLKVVIGLSSKGQKKLSRDLKSTENSFRDSMKNIGSSMRKVGGVMTAAVTAPLAAMAVKSVQAFNEQAKAVAQVEAGLKSTGNQVGYTSQQLQNLASNLQNKTLFGDEEILKGATSQLLTFTNIAGQQFARTQEVALDLATRLDGDLKSSSIMLGKALNDPVANLSALSRAGIQFSADQKEVVKSLVETGKLAEAQTLILDELEKQYGGSAEAAAKAGTGPFKQLSNALGDLQEQFGKLILEFIQPVIPKLQQVMSALLNMSQETKRTVLMVAAALGAAGPIAMAIGALIPVIAAIASPLGLIVLAIGAVVTAVFYFREEISQPLADVANFFIDIYNEVAPIRIAVAILTGAVKTNFKIIALAAKTVFDSIKTIGDALYALIVQGDIEKAKEVFLNGFKDIGIAVFDEAVSIGEEFGTGIEDGLKNRLENVNAQDISDALDLSGLLDFSMPSFSGATAVPVAITPVVTNITAQGQDVGIDEEELIDEPHIDALVTDYEKHMKRVRLATQNATSVFGFMDSAIGAAFDNIKDKSAGFHLFLKSMLESLLQRAVALVATFAALSVITGGSAGALTALGKGSFKEFFMGGMGVAGFATGGLVTGPTLGMIGEGPGTTLSNPEVIAPLDKLQQMMGGGNVTVTGMIRGSDILLSNERSLLDRNRTRGF